MGLVPLMPLPTRYILRVKTGSKKGFTYEGHSSALATRQACCHCKGMARNMSLVFYQLVQTTWEEAHNSKRKVCNICASAGINEHRERYQVLSLSG